MCNFMFEATAVFILIAVKVADITALYVGCAANIGSCHSSTAVALKSPGLFLDSLTREWSHQGPWNDGKYISNDTCWQPLRLKPFDDTPYRCVREAAYNNGDICYVQSSVWRREIERKTFRYRFGFYRSIRMMTECWRNFCSSLFSYWTNAERYDCREPVKA